MVRMLYELDGHLDALTQELHSKYGLNPQKTVRNEFNSIDILLIDTSYPCGNDWKPHMSFTIFFLQKKITLKSIRLPKELQNKGIGSLCFAWLIDLCKHYELIEIDGEAIDSSKPFWNQKGCIETPKRTIYPVK